MRVFVAGATGVVGRELIPLLQRAGHAVTGMTRSVRAADALRATGADALVADALDRDAVITAVRAARPDAVVHQLTSIPPHVNVRRLDRDFRPTNILRTTATDILLDAARAAGATRFVAQSFAGWTYARTGGPLKTELDPLDPTPPRRARRTLDAIRHLEDAVLRAPGLAGIALRYGFFYGPHTSMAPHGQYFEAVRARRLPLVGDATGIWSFVHVHDAATAAFAAIERGDPGLYNIADDEPAPLAEWLPTLAAALRAPRPHRIPTWLARPLVGPAGIAFMTTIRGLDSSKARRELQWQPRYATWRQGFLTLLAPDRSDRLDRPDRPDRSDRPGGV